MIYEIEYYMFGGKTIRKKRFIESKLSSMDENTFVSQVKEEPQGMFRISSVKGLQIVLEQIDCDEIHWKGDEKGHAYNSDEDCKRKGCKFYENCPISTHIMLISDT